MADLCSELGPLSEELNTWLSAQPGVKEESLTDWLLYELSKRCSQVSYKAFTRHQEAKYTGADWDWIFVFNDGCIRLRVQAKKLFENKDNQKEILRSNKYGRQIDTLISSAKRKSVFPMYAFFSINTSTTACQNKPANIHGAYLCGAETVLSNLASPKRKIMPSDALALSYPMPCIACCSLLVNPKSAINLSKQLQRYFVNSNTTVEDNEDLPGYFQHIPSFALNVLENEGVFPEWWEIEYEREFEDVSAVVIIDVRD